MSATLDKTLEKTDIAYRVTYSLDNAFWRYANKNICKRIEERGMAAYTETEVEKNAF